MLGPRLRRRFKVEAAMYSARTRVGGLTITTGGAPNRLAMLDDLCATWVGPLIVAVWVPVIAPGAKSERNVTDLAAVEANIRALFDRSALAELRHPPVATTVNQLSGPQPVCPRRLAAE